MEPATGSPSVGHPGARADAVQINVPACCAPGGVHHEQCTGTAAGVQGGAFGGSAATLRLQPTYVGSPLASQAVHLQQVRASGMP